MSKAKRGLGNVEFDGKVKTQIFKQFQLEQLIKDGTVILESKLAEAKEQELSSIPTTQIEVFRLMDAHQEEK